MQLARPGPDRVESLDLNAIVRDVIMMLRGAAKLGRVDIKLDFETNPMTITANRVRIEQIIFNLVVNAVDAIGEAPGAVTLATFVTNGRAVCKISDTGSGIPPETLARIFEPLFTTKGDKGTGFGLPVARDIVQGYGGKLTCESKLGDGTTFTFDLPQ
jgi:signal transduction histidine kinase